MRDDRQFERTEISIPCRISCRDQMITGRIVNLSPGGAFITEATEIPAEGSLIVLTLQDDHGISLRARVNSKVIHSFWEITEDTQIASFGVEFQELEAEVKSKLEYLFV